jgi:hydroxymethylbilane synthase
MKLRFGARGSALAKWQTLHVAERLKAMTPGLEIEQVEITSQGDRIQDVPLSHVEGTGFFTAAIQEVLLRGEIDVAVHSYKDLPVEPVPGLLTAAVPVRGPVEDVWCARGGMKIMDLPKGARVGTCSARRTAQIRLVRDDLEIVSLRGNVPTRVARLGRDLDAIVLARAGLLRLGLESAITEIFPIEKMLPAPAQGALAVECRSGDDAVRECLRVLNDVETERAVTAERSMLHALGGGCSVPVGAAARVVSGRIHLAGGVFGLATRRTARVSVEGTDPNAVGELAAARLLQAGASGILEEFEKAWAGTVVEAGA